MSKEGNEEQTLGAKQEKSTELSDEQLDEAAGGGEVALGGAQILPQSFKVDLATKFDIGGVKKVSDVELADTEKLLMETGPDGPD